MPLEIQPAHDFPIPRLADLFTRAYQGYIAGNFAMDPPAFARLVSQHGVDLWLSRVAVRDGTPVGFGLINRTGDIARLASLGVVAEARRLGVGRELVHRLLDESRQRGERAMMLEVIEQNPAAVALYEQLGFEHLGRLLGWRRAADAIPPAPGPRDAGAPREIPLHRAASGPSAVDYPELPWQVSRHAIAKVAPLARAFESADARLICTQLEVEPIRILGLFSPQDGEAAAIALRNLLRSVMARFPGRVWWLPAIFPEHPGREIFEPLGFVQEPLNQFLSRRSLV